MPDLSDLPGWLKALIVYGPLGIWAAIATYGYFKQNAAFHAVRDAFEASTKDTSEKRAAELKAMFEAHAQDLKAMGEAFATHYAEQAQAATAQQKELTAEFVSQTKTTNAGVKEVTDTVMRLVDSVSRHRDRSS